MSSPSSTTIALAELSNYVGKHLGSSEWHLVDQAQIDAFADATGDHQWIHVDAEKAKAGPFGTTIAHGYLTLSLGPKFIFEILEVTGAKLVINYGLNKTRFPSTVPAGSRVRLNAELTSVEPFQGGLQAVITETFEVENQAKPACVAEVVFRYYE